MLNSVGKNIDKRCSVSYRTSPGRSTIVERTISSTVNTPPVVANGKKINHAEYKDKKININNGLAKFKTPKSILDDGGQQDDKMALHSIIDLRNKENHIHRKNKKIKQENILIEEEIDEFNYYQQHWFSASLEKFKMEDRSREERIEITRHEFLRQIQQIRRSNVGKPNKMPNWRTAKEQSINERRYKGLDRRKRESGGGGGNVIVTPKLCEVDNCNSPALILTKYCLSHIMLDSRQVLFEHCTAKFADNTQCSAPVLDMLHQLPLCTEHARKRDKYRLYEEAKPKKIRKKVKPSAMIRPQKRNKKKKRQQQQQMKSVSNIPIINDAVHISNTPHSSNLYSKHMAINGISGRDEIDGIVKEEDEEEVEATDIPIDQVLELNDNGLEHALLLSNNQTRLLEESDINNVLSTIHVDEFSDFFAVNRNGDFEPSREEAEELEKALAAVDNDMKSLEKLTETHRLLESFLEEHSLTESLGTIPEIFPSTDGHEEVVIGGGGSSSNGSGGGGDNGASIIRNNAVFLLPEISEQTSSTSS